MKEFSGNELNRAKGMIDSLNINPIMERLVQVEKWRKKQAFQACEQYRNYLFLLKKYGNRYSSENLPPSLDIDAAWHAHILFTEKYIEFCNNVFGKYLHHHPHHGQDSIKISDIKLESMFEITQELYYKEFGDYIYAIRPLPFKTYIKNYVKKLKRLTFQRSFRCRQKVN